MNITTVHIPVLADEVCRGLNLQPGQTVVDGTAGGGGHTARLLEQVSPGGRVIALDRDPQAAERLRTRFAGQPVVVFCANYCNLGDILHELSLPSVDAILLDLGLSSDQLADVQRGFSFQAEGPLDLRFDPTTGVPAWKWLEEVSERELAEVIRRYGEERFSRRIARRIVQQRRHEPIRTARQLADLVQRCVPRSPRQRIHPATRTFQALRIAVNQELDAVALALQRFPEWLRPGGRLAVISYHSLEDRLVKTAFRQDSRYVTLTKKPIRPNEAEIARNPRSRSAKLRIAMRAEESG
jgi:16S rRNA (cytosine1402-N4)-methyltransferase